MRQLKGDGKKILEYSIYYIQRKFIPNSESDRFNDFNFQKENSPLIYVNV